MELNDNSSNKRKSSRNLSSSPISITKNTNFKTDNSGNSKESVVCTFCSKRTAENFAILNDKPELLGTLTQLDIEISSINDYFDYICYQCIFKIHCIQDYKRIWTANIYKTRINHYYRRGDKEMVRRLITLKPSTSTRATHQSRTRSSASLFNGNETKEGSIISHSTDNNSNFGKDDRSQNSEKEASQITKKPTSNNVDLLKISSVNSLHNPIINNKEKRQKLKQQNSTNSNDKNSVNAQIENNMPRRSSILTNETNDLNQANNSLVENGFFQENSIHIRNDSILLPNNKKHQKTIQLMGKEMAPSNEVDTLLNVMYEENEPACLTESGGKVSSRISLYKEPVNMKCKYCERVYKRLTYLMKHQRKHERDNQRATSVKSASSKGISKASIFDCLDCEENFRTKRMLNKHRRIHLKEFTCKYCSKVFILKWEADFHEAVCSGKAQAKQTQIGNSSNASNVTRYYTRSLKQKFKETESKNKKKLNNNAENENNDEDEDEDEYEFSEYDTTEIDSLYSCRLRNTIRWTEQVTKLQNGRETELHLNNRNYDDTGQSLGTINGKSKIFNRKQKKSISVTNTNNKPRSYRSSKNFNKEAIQSTRNIQPAFDAYDALADPSDISSEGYNDDTVFVFIKCQNNGCEYQNVKLENVMRHDEETHGIRPLYYCKKCKGSFLREYYYQLHCANQDPGCFLCYKCRAEFFYEELLHTHLEEHNYKETYNEVYPCNLCKMEFLDETTLMKHLATREHLKLKATPKIRFIIKNSYPKLQSSQQNLNNINNNMVYDSTLLREEQLLHNNYNFENNNNSIENNGFTEPQYSQTKIFKLKKYESKNYKYQCNCIKKTCYKCQKHRKMIPIYGREPRPTKHYPYRSCNEVRLPYLKSWWLRYI